MRTSRTRSFWVAVVAASVGVASSITTAVPAEAMPERFADAGTIVLCEGDGGHLEAYDTTQGGVNFVASIVTKDGEATAYGEDALLVGDRLEGTFPAQYQESDQPAGDLGIDGTLSWGAAEVVSGWDVDPDGRRYRSEGTRIPLSGSVSLTLGATQAILDCSGWEIDLETFVLTRGPAASNSRGWLLDGYELDGAAGTVGFYGARRMKLGVGLEFVDPVSEEVYAFGGEELAVRHGRITGTLVLRHPETFEVVGAASVHGTLTRTGSERVVEAGKTYRWVTTLVHYDVTLTITTAKGQWSGAWPATYETLRTRATIPPRAL